MKDEKSKQPINLSFLYEIGMAILALIILAILILEFSIPLTEQQLNLFMAIDLSILAIFAIDYFYRLYKAPNKLVFFKNNIFDLIAIIPLDKTFRIARLARLARLARFSRLGRAFRLFRLVRIALFFKKFFGGVTKLLKTNGLHYMIAFTVLLIFLGAFGILHFESGNGNIATFGDAIWWSLVTTTTVGYGDISPSTSGGRILAGSLMILGIGFLGMVTGAIATFFVDKVITSKGEKSTKVVDEQVAYIKNKLDDIEILSFEDIKAVNDIIFKLWEIKKTNKRA